jgi:hypothetical protein
MRQLIMDGAEVDLKASFNQLGELLDTLRDRVPEGRIITHLYLDEREILQDGPEKMRDHLLEPVGTVRVETSPLMAQITRNVAELQTFLKEMRPVLRQAGRELRYGAVTNASTRLADCFDGMETAVRSIEQLAPLLSQLNAGLSDDDLQHFSNREGDLLAELVADFQRKDWLSLADRLEFQLDPLMGRWQAVVNRVMSALQSQAASG